MSKLRVDNIFNAVKSIIQSSKDNNLKESLIDSIRDYTGTYEWLKVDPGSKMSLEILVMLKLRSCSTESTDMCISIGWYYLNVRTSQLDFKVRYEDLSITTLKVIHDFLLNYYVLDDEDPVI